MDDIEDLRRGGARRCGSGGCRRLCASPCASQAAGGYEPEAGEDPLTLESELGVDVLIVGAGVIGCAIARELSKLTVSVMVVDKAHDVAEGASKANSGIVHGGYDARHGTLKARLAHAGNQMFAQLNSELCFGLKNTGSLTLGFGEEDRRALEELAENGRKNGVEGLVILDGPAVRALEPRVNPAVTCALLCPHTGITSPYEYAIALAENAVDNGVRIRLREEVHFIEPHAGGGYVVRTSRGSHRARAVINAAGLGSQRVAAMVGADTFTIVPRKGEYLLLNKSEGRMAKHVLFQCPHPVKGKGVLVSPTYHGNMLIGPTSRDPGEDAPSKAEIMHYLVSTARRSLPGVDPSRTITSYSGNRAKADCRDFIVEESKAAPGFVNCAGIDSPGLTSSPAVAKMVVDEILRPAAARLGLRMDRNTAFYPFRRRIILPKPADFAGTVDNDDPRLNIVCRCERVTEAEIVESVHRGVPARSTDAVKKRTRAGTGPCQGRFCEPRVVKLVARETGLREEDVPRRGARSSLLPHRRVTQQDREFLSKL